MEISDDEILIAPSSQELSHAVQGVAEPDHDKSNKDVSLHVHAPSFLAHVHEGSLSG